MSLVKVDRMQSEARYPSGKGEVCKTFMRRFDPDPRLHNLNNLRTTESFIEISCGRFCGHMIRYELQMAFIRAPCSPSVLSQR